MLYDKCTSVRSARILHCCVNQNADERHLGCRFFIIIFLSSCAQMMVGLLCKVCAVVTSGPWDPTFDVITIMCSRASPAVPVLGAYCVRAVQTVHRFAG